MLAAMIRIEHAKLYRRHLLWVELGLVGGLVLALFVMLAVLQASGLLAEAAAPLEDLMGWPNSLLVALNMSASGSLGGLLVAVLVAVVVAQEYQWQTTSLWLRQGVSRLQLLTAKVVTLTGAILLLVLAPLVVGGATSAVVAIIQGGPERLTPVPWGELALAVLRTAYSLLPYMALTLAIAIRTRNMAASIGIGVGYSLLVEEILAQLLVLVGGVPGRIAMYLPGQMAAALNNLNAQVASLTAGIEGAEQAMALMPTYLAPNVAMIGIAVYTVAFTAIAVLLFRRQDLTA